MEKKRYKKGKYTLKGEKLNFSKSQFMTYLSCQKKYYLKYHKGWTEPSDKENFLKGNAIHDFWENMYSDYCSVDVENENITIEKTLTDKQRQYYSMIQNIVRFEEKRLKTVKEKNLDVEKYFYPVEQEERIEVNGMRGLPDAIYRRADGTLEVFDLKSSFYSSWKHEYEILFYAKLVDKSDKFDQPVTGGGLFAAGDEKVRYYEFSRYQMMELESMMEQFRRGIDQGKFEPCGMNWCKWDQGPPEEATRKPERIRR